MRSLCAVGDPSALRSTEASTRATAWAILKPGARDRSPRRTAARRWEGPQLGTPARAELKPVGARAQGGRVR